MIKLSRQNDSDRFDLILASQNVGSKRSYGRWIMDLRTYAADDAVIAPAFKCRRRLFNLRNSIRVGSAIEAGIDCLGTVGSSCCQLFQVKRVTGCKRTIYKLEILAGFAGTDCSLDICRCNSKLSV